MSDPQHGGISRQVSLVRATPRVGRSIAYSLSEVLRERATVEDVTHTHINTLRLLGAPSDVAHEQAKLNRHGGTCGLVEKLTQFIGCGGITELQVRLDDR